MFHEERVRDKTVHAVSGYPSLSHYVRVFLIDNEWTKKKLHCSFRDAVREVEWDYGCWACFWAIWSFLVVTLLA